MVQLYPGATNQKLSYGQVKQLALNAGFTGQSANTITAIVYAESGGNTAAFAPNDGGKGYNSYGLAQINGIHTGAVNAVDPQTSLNMAYQISNNGTNFKPWSTYNNGQYQDFLSSASAADPLSTNFNRDLSTNSGTSAFGAAGEYGVGQDQFNGPGPAGYPTDSGGVPTGTPDYGATGEYGVGQTVPSSNATTAGGAGNAYDTSNTIGGVLNNPPTQSSAANTAAFWNWLSVITQDFVVRFGVILLGIILVAAAVWALAKDTVTPSIPRGV